MATMLKRLASSSNDTTRNTPRTNVGDVGAVDQRMTAGLCLHLCRPFCPRPACIKTESGRHVCLGIGANNIDGLKALYAILLNIFSGLPFQLRKGWRKVLHMASTARCNF